MSETELRTKSRRRRLTIAALLLLVLGGGLWRSTRSQSKKVDADADSRSVEPSKSASITMRQVLDGSEPILLVCHDEDGWQFIGTSDASVADGRVVAYDEIARLDPTILEIADLEPGWQAVRERVGAPWLRRKRPDERHE